MQARQSSAQLVYSPSVVASGFISNTSKMFKCFKRKRAAYSESPTTKIYYLTHGKFPLEFQCCSIPMLHLYLVSIQILSQGSKKQLPHSIISSEPKFPTDYCNFLNLYIAKIDIGNDFWHLCSFRLFLFILMPDMLGLLAIYSWR